MGRHGHDTDPIDVGPEPNHAQKVMNSRSSRPSKSSQSDNLIWLRDLISVLPRRDRSYGTNMGYNHQKWIFHIDDDHDYRAIWLFVGRTCPYARSKSRPTLLLRYPGGQGGDMLFDARWLEGEWADVVMTQIGLSMIPVKIGIT